MNNHSASTGQPEFEEWHLTALALGDLDPELVASTQHRIDTDPHLARQYAEIQSTLATLEKGLAGPSAMRPMDAARREEVMANIHSTTQVPKTSGEEARQDLRRVAVPWRVAAVTSLLALAASVVLFLRWTGSPSVEIQTGTRLTYEIEAAEHPANNRSAQASLPAPSSSDTANEVSGGESTQLRQAKPNIIPSTPGPDLLAYTSEANSGRYVDGHADGLAGGGRGSIQNANELKLEPSEVPVGGMGGMPRPTRPGMGGEAQSDISKTVQSGDPAIDPSRIRIRAADGTVADRRKAYQKLFSTESGKKATEVEGRPLKEEELAQSTKDLPEELRANVPSFRPRLRESGDRFDAMPETPFVTVDQEPLSTFSIDVDTASYSKLRQYVLEQQTLPTADTVRIEEWINYFDYGYPGPKDDSPFAAHLRLAKCPWNPEHKLVRVAIAAKKPSTEERPSSNLVFLIDVSGSMSDSNKLPLVKRTLQLLISQLREQDRVAIVVYAGAAGCVLPSTSGANKETILASINELQSGGSTNGGQGIQLAYNIAKEHFVSGGINRVILCTDGDFNVGVTGTDQLVSMMREKVQSNIFLTCLGFGIGNYNDSMMEQVSNQGNGIYAMVDSELEAKRVMVEQLSGTLMTVAKDVKLQIEFNPAKVASYRLIGYENRRLATKDFADDRKDAGEIGAGHCVTALYEVVPAGAATVQPADTELRYAKRKQADAASKPEAGDSVAEHAQEWLYLKIRSKQPEASESTLQSFVLSGTEDESYSGDQSDMDWASSVAEFGLLMRRSQLASDADWDRMIARAIENAGSDPYRRECILIMQQSKRLMGP